MRSADVPLGALLDTDGGLYGKYKAGRALAAAALLHGLQMRAQGTKEEEEEGGAAMAPSLPPPRENFVILRQPLWVMRHDEDAEVAQAVAQAWELWQTQVQGQHGGVTSETGTGGSGFPVLCASLFEFPAGAVRRAAAKTVAGHSGLPRPALPPWRRWRPSTRPPRPRRGT